MAKRAKNASPKPSAPQFDTFVDVAGYNISQLLADRGPNEPVALIRLLRKQNKVTIDVGYVLFFPDRKKLPTDWVQGAGTNRETIIMHAHTIDYERILDVLLNEAAVRVYFSGESEDNGIAEIRSLRENF